MLCIDINFYVVLMFSGSTYFPLMYTGIRVFYTDYGIVNTVYFCRIFIALRGLVVVLWCMVRYVVV